MPKSSKPRTYSASYYTININLKSPYRKGGPTFLDVLSDPRVSKKGVLMKGNVVMYFRQVHRATIEGIPAVYGTISKNINVEGMEWKDKDTAELVDVKIPDGAVPGLKDLMFVYVPEYHRLLFRSNQSFSPKVVLRFIEMFVNAHINRDEEYLTVTLHQSKDQVKKLQSAKFIQKLKVKITYTNDGFSSLNAGLVDRLMRESNIPDIEMTASSKGSSKIAPDGAFVQGAIDLAVENGFAEISYVDEHFQKKTIKTIEHPEIKKIEIEGDTNSPIHFAVSALLSFINGIKKIL